MNMSKCFSLLALTWLAGAGPLAAQGTAFTYQGSLTDGGNPANGTYNLRFSLYTSATTSTASAGPITTNGVAVSNGLFTVTIDFGANPWDGTAYWLGIGVETNGAGSFKTISPRQELTPAPYSIFATTAGDLSGTLPASQLTGTVPLARLPGAVVTNNENSVTVSNFTATGNLSLPLPADLACDFSFLGSPATNHLMLADTTLNFSAGLFAGNQTMTGGDNTGVGSGALSGNTTGNGNTALGAFALEDTSTGGTNAAVGDAALQANTTGFDNAALGASAR